MMKKSGVYCAAIVLLPGIALAAGAFDGTWKVSLNHVQLSKKPLVYSLSDGNYTCSSCVPAFTVKADGTDQKVAGHDFDTVAVTVNGPDSVQVARKLKGKPLSTIKDTVSSDGNRISEEETSFSGAQPVVVKLELKRTAPAAPGAHALSGSWVQSKVISVSDSGAIETLHITDDGFSMNGNGQSYDAKFDGKKYPLVGDPTNTMVSLKKVSPTEVVESDYEHGKLIETVRMSVSSDGKTLNIVDSQLREGRTLHYHLDKQP
jgi:hypothetical protein